MKQITGTVEATTKDGMTGAEKSEKSPVTYLEFENSDDVLTFLSGSEIKLTDGTVLVSAPADEVTDGKVTKSAADVLKARVSDFLRSLNYGLNLNARSDVRSTLMAKLEGPDKAINKLVADIVKARAAAGKPVTEQAARKIAVAMLGMDETPAETPAAATA